jgi:hypothetical protein
MLAIQGSTVQAMLMDGILEESYSAYINPLTLVHNESKPIRICVDARINKLMVADRVKVQPMRELLQRFHGSSYITSLDLSRAFLQVLLSKGSRKWTAFQFQTRVYQYMSVPYGFKNSLSAFIRALEKVLGDDVVYARVRILEFYSLFLYSLQNSRHWLFLPYLSLFVLDVSF